MTRVKRMDHVGVVVVSRYRVKSNVQMRTNSTKPFNFQGLAVLH